MQFARILFDYNLKVDCFLHHVDYPVTLRSIISFTSLVYTVFSWQYLDSSHIIHQNELTAMSLTYLNQLQVKTMQFDITNGEN